ncbi:MAG: hypothetical protein HY558_00980 [Euryarchaeota archaeon]|nr:hypothetical protein [Euryarchaeota archaeon]
MPADAGRTQKLTIGIELLDQILGGGVPAGSMVCLVANPESMAEVLLYQFASTRKTYYFTTIRRPEYVQRNMRDLNFKIDNVEFINVYSRFNIREQADVTALPTARKNLYTISHHNSQRSTRIFVKQANMPKDMFWKFNFWSKEKALAVVGEIADKIFSEMMKVNEKAIVKMTDADPQNARFTISYADCDECAGLSGSHSPTCAYHAGIFAGLFSTLLGQEFEAYETQCHATGAPACTFTLGSKANADVQASLQSFLNPPVASASLGALAFMEQNMAGIQRNSNLVVDQFSFFVEMAGAPDKVRQLLNVIYEVTNRTESITILFLLKDSHPQELEKMVLSTCDAVFSLEVHESGQEMETVINIAKIRGAVSPHKRVRVMIGERVQIDTRKEIA